MSIQATELQNKSETPNLMSDLMHKFDNLMKDYEMPIIKIEEEDN
jgi:hypothetical protein